MKQKRTFTLVELIIVIAIIAILAVTAFLLLTKWLSKARDSSRASNLANIENSLQISLTENSSLPKPDSYTLIYASGTSNIVGYQGFFGEGVKDAVGNINSAPKDGDDYFTYYLNSNLNKYQIAGFMENETAYNSNVVNAVDYSSRYINVKGDKLGLLTDANKSPVQMLGLTGVDILNTTSTYYAYMTNKNSVSGTGKSLISMLTMSDKNAAKYDTGLIGYWDMETSTTSGGLNYVKDLSNKANDGKPGAGVKVGDSVGMKGKSTNFNGSQYFSIKPSDAYTGLKQISISSWVNFSKINAGETYEISQKREGWTYGYNNGNFWFELRSDSAYITAWLVPWTPKIGQRYNVICTYDGSKIRMYVDGQLYSSVGATVTNATIMNPSNAWHHIGDGGWRDDVNGNGEVSSGAQYTTRRIYGQIDELRIYNRALSDDEVKALYNAN